MRDVRIGQWNGLPLVREEDSVFTKERLSTYVCSVRGRPQAPLVATRGRSSAARRELGPGAGEHEEPQREADHRDGCRDDQHDLEKWRRRAPHPAGLTEMLM